MQFLLKNMGYYKKKIGYTLDKDIQFKNSVLKLWCLGTKLE